MGQRNAAVYRGSGVTANRGVAVPDTGVPDGDAPPVGTVRRMPAVPGVGRDRLGGVRCRAAGVVPVIPSLAWDDAGLPLEPDGGYVAD